MVDRESSVHPETCGSSNADFSFGKSPRATYHYRGCFSVPECGAGMAHGIFYDVDGRMGGPITLTQLQLMAASGMLMPHHRIRRENADQWYAARSVKGLFSEETQSPSTTPVPSAGAGRQSYPVGSPLTPPPGPVATDESAAATIGGSESPFDFFSEPGVPPTSGAMPQQAQLEAAAGAAREPAENPFAFVEPAGPPPPAMPEIEVVADEGSGTTSSGSRKPAERKPPARPGDSGKPKSSAAPSASAPLAEVTGRTVDLLPDNSLQIMDGKTSFRLCRPWLLATSKFADGSARTSYLRLQGIDAAILDQRPVAVRGKGGPQSLLAFVAGNVRVGLLFQGNEAPYRAFLEKVLLLSNALCRPAVGKP